MWLAAHLFRALPTRSAPLLPRTDIAAGESQTGRDGGQLRATYSEEAAPPPLAPEPVEDKYAKLKGIKELLDGGILIEESFAVEKAEILAGYTPGRS